MKCNAMLLAVGMVIGCTWPVFAQQASSSGSASGPTSTPNQAAPPSQDSAPIQNLPPIQDLIPSQVLLSSQASAPVQLLSDIQDLYADQNLSPSQISYANQLFQTKGLHAVFPESSISRPGYVHTHLVGLVKPNAGVSPDVGASPSPLPINSPATIRAAYFLPSVGGSGAIAIVDAYDDPNALSDFNTFAQQYGLPQESSSNATSSSNNTFQVVYASGSQPTSDPDWNAEESLDIEWAHAIAPYAKIYLVEATSAAQADMFTAVQVASGLTGVQEVSMSWSEDESVLQQQGYTTSNLQSWDATYFSTPGIVYLAAGGDVSDLEGYPSTSPNVISCGGTTLNLSNTGLFLSETGWSSAGCGPSIFEPRPAFQNGIAGIVGNWRGANDISFDADPNTGFNIYDSNTPPLGLVVGWNQVGGTSAATPCLAGALNLGSSSPGNYFASSTSAAESLLYSNLGNSHVFRDITVGTDGSESCAVGWDFVTGVGTPIGLSGYNPLQNPSPSGPAPGP